MQVAVLHYHYRPGGVTRVIENTLPTLQKEHNVDVQVIEVPGLDYSSPETFVTDSETLIQSIEETARKLFGSLPDLWHIHNPSLGKHPAFPSILQHLAESQTPLLLHIHDFAEDSRPANYELIRKNPASEKLYPISSQIHYGVLNQRDYSILQRSAIPEEHLHIIPNPVVPPKSLDTKKEDSFPGKKLHLYPVRATQRKNLGELALLAMLAEEGHHFANSIGPTNPNQRESFQSWKHLAKEMSLPLDFGLCENPNFDFPDVLASASSCVTTSMAEGFGLSFLEPTLLGKPLWGRNITEITKDFTDHGIDLDHLYTRMPIPLSWLKVDTLQKKLESKLGKVYEQYHMPLPGNAVTEAWESLSDQNQIDFGHLDQEDQTIILQNLHKEPALKAELPKFQDLVNDSSPESSQSDIIGETYSPKTCAKKLFQIYSTLLEKPRESICYLDPEKILSQFLSPRRFSFLLT